MPKNSNPTNRIDTRLSLVVNRRDSHEKREQQDTMRDTLDQVKAVETVMFYSKREIIRFRIDDDDSFEIDVVSVANLFAVLATFVRALF